MIRIKIFEGDPKYVRFSCPKCGGINANWRARCEYCGGWTYSVFRLLREEEAKINFHLGKGLR